MKIYPCFLIITSNIFVMIILVQNIDFVNSFAKHLYKKN